MEREGRKPNAEENIALNKGNEEVIGQPGDFNQQINMNHYATKKSAAQSMLDVALLMANSSQLKTVLYVGPEYRFYIPLIVLLSLSIILQVVVGLLLVFIVKYDLNDIRKQKKLNTMNNVATVLVFFTVLVNIFITALGFESGRDRVMGLANVPVPQMLGSDNDTDILHRRFTTLGHSTSP